MAKIGTGLAQIIIIIIIIRRRFYGPLLVWYE